MHPRRGLVPADEHARAVAAKDGVGRVLRVGVRVVARGSDDGLGVVAGRVACGQAAESAAPARVSGQFARVAPQFRDRRAPADDCTLGLRLRRLKLGAEPGHVGQRAAYGLLRQAERKLVPGLQQDAAASRRRRAQALAHGAVGRLAEVPALRVLRVRATGAKGYLHVRKRRAGERAEVRSLGQVRQYEPLPVRGQLILPAVG